MVAALIPFSTTEFLNVRALGIGVAVAVLLDVLIVRPVLLPAAAAVLGRRGWWPTSGPTPARSARRLNSPSDGIPGRTRPPPPPCRHDQENPMTL